jgi:nickel-dependent lactate racemase
LTRDDLIKKLGIDIVDRMYVLNHNAYENLEFLGHSSRGVPIFVNRDFMACDLRIALGMLTPRGGFFGGGSKLLIPGACGHVTITANHRYVHEGFREHLDEVARMAGLRFIVNPLLNSELEITGMVAGDPEAAFWKGVEYGKDLYKTPIPENMDVGIFNAFPKDTEFMQAGLAMVPMGSSRKNLLKDNATVVICSASPEGLGWHSVLGPGTALAGKPSSARRKTIVFSPGINKWDVLAKHGESYLFCKTWKEVLDELGTCYGSGTRAAVFPCGALQYGGE